MIANSFLMKVKTNYLQLWPPKYQYLLETAMKKGIFSIRNIMKQLIFLMIVWMKLLVHTIMFLQHVTGNYFDDERIFRCKNLSKSKKLWRTCLQSQFLLTGKSSYVKGRGDNSIDLSVRHCMGIDFSIIFQSGIIGLVTIVVDCSVTFQSRIIVSGTFRFPDFKVSMAEQGDRSSKSWCKTASPSEWKDWKLGWIEKICR